MLRYASVGISELEIPNNKSLVIYLSNCQNKCYHCHTPYLNEDYGEVLRDYFNQIIEVYFNYFDIVCFMGEGKNTIDEHREFNNYCTVLHKMNKQAALYCGRNCGIEEWMNCFDYIKIGSYIESNGSLYSKKTNQKLYKKENDIYIDITYLFWY